MPVREEITYILVHDRMPSHPKVRPMTDGAFRLMVEAWCFCGEHVTDGRIERDVWATMGTPKARQELLRRGIARELTDGDIEMHDYLDINRSAAEVEAARSKKSAGGKLGNHRRHHINKRVLDPKCDYCLKGVA